MAQQIIDIGSADDDGTGDTFRAAFDKVNDNDTELFPLATNALSKTLAPAQSVVSDVNFLGVIQKSGVDLITTDNALSKTTGSAQTVVGSVDFTGGLLVNGDLVVIPTKRVVVNALSDLPTPIASEITLVASTQYFIGNDINIGTNRILMGQDSVFTGLDENVITVTYTGTGTMFTAVDVDCRVKAICAASTSGTFLDASNTAGSEGTSNVIIDNVDIQTSVIGNIANLNILGIFRCAFNSVTTSGWSFTGSLGNAFTMNDCTIIQGAGSFIELGVATFLSFDINNYLMIGSGGTTFLSGAAASANIRAGGLGRVIRGRDLGAETVLSGITVDDALWEFFLNDSIPNTRPDGLLSMQSNAVATVIAVAGTPVLIAGTWVVERTSQFTGTTGGRLTSNGGKDSTLPITGSFTVEPVSGGAVSISVEAAINGSVVPNSKRTGNTSAGNPISITSPWQEVLSTTDFVEYFVTNETTTVNILVSSAVERIN